MAGPFATPIIPSNPQSFGMQPEVQRMPVLQDPKQAIRNAQMQSIGEAVGGLATSFIGYKTEQYQNAPVEAAINDFNTQAAEKIKEADTLPAGAGTTLNDLMNAQAQGKITRQQLFGESRALRNKLVADNPWRQKQIDQLFNQKLGYDPRGSEFGDLMKGTGTAGNYGNGGGSSTNELKQQIGKQMLEAGMKDPNAANMLVFQNPKDLGSLDVQSTYMNMVQSQRLAGVIKNGDKQSALAAQNAAQASEQAYVVASANNIAALGQIASNITGDKVTYQDPNDPSKTVTEDSNAFWQKRKQATVLKTIEAEKQIDAIESQYAPTTENRAMFNHVRERIASQRKIAENLTPQNAVIATTSAKALAEQSSALGDQAKVDFSKFSPKLFQMASLFPQATNEVAKDVLSTGSAQVDMIKNKASKGEPLTAQDQLTIGMHDYFVSQTSDQKINARLDANHSNLVNPDQPIAAVDPIHQGHVFKTQYRATRAQMAIDPATVPTSEVNAWANSTGKVFEYTVSQGVDDYSKVLPMMTNPRFQDYMDKVEDPNAKAKVVDNGVKVSTSSVVGVNGAIPRISKMMEPLAVKYPEVGKVEINLDTGNAMYNPTPVAPVVGMGVSTIGTNTSDRIRQSVISQTQMDVRKQVDQINQAVDSIQTLGKYDPTLKNMTKPEILSSLMTGVQPSAGIVVTGTPKMQAQLPTTTSVAAATNIPSNTPAPVVAAAPAINPEQQATQDKLNAALKQSNEPLPSVSDVIKSVATKVGKAVVPDANGAPGDTSLQLTASLPANLATPQVTRAIKEVSSTVAAGDKPLAMEVATSYLGKSEHSDAKVLAQAFKKAGIEANPETTPWCAAFVNAVLAESGTKGTGSLAARSFLKYGEPTDKPTTGDIVVLTRGNDDGVHGHVGFYKGMSEDGKKIIVLGGNQGDKVSEKEYDASRVLGYRKIPKGDNLQKAVEHQLTLPPEIGSGQASLPFPEGQGIPKPITSKKR